MSSDSSSMTKIHRLSKPNIDQESLIRSTNRIILPSEWESLLFTDKSAQQYCVPPLFEITALKNNKKVYVGFESCSIRKFVIVPPWVLNILGNENEEVRVTRIRQLDLCTGMTLIPLQSLFFDEIENPEFCLLNALHFKYSAITKGQIIELGFGAKTFSVLIGDCKPQESVYLLNCQAECKVDPKYKADKHTKINIDQPTEEMFVDSGDYKYLRLMHVRNTSCLCINVDTNIGDTAVFVSRKDKFPKLNRFYWSSIQYETGSSGDGDDEEPILIPSAKMILQSENRWNEDESDYVEDIYIGILGVGSEAAHFVVRVSEIPQEQYQNQLKEQQEYHRSCHVKFTDEDDDEDDEEEEEEEEDDEWEYEDESSQLVKQEAKPKQLPMPPAPSKPKVVYKRCSNCHEKLPEERVVMHERYCAQKIKICPTCSFKVGVNHFDKHTQLIHTPIICACGLHISSVRNIPMHLQGHCPENEEVCPVCSLRVKRRSWLKHREECDHAIFSCAGCGLRMNGSNLLQHIRTVHTKKKQ
ncbi:MAG: hypothetical protein EZS28_029708 [Streblomastix strix]|uniref:Uncharacterized protein n=1 Tax=Streblomastix strix TaxID=222440 RepID=A0A5J4UX04_9EUKA|nr:MAG: hypothetical protein EZS28_029708 [Streblomastix strix]